ncbi:MAG: acyl-CoA dehydrogenase family protein, partial [Polyangia bacterium]|nr:acyl-CoA dehydrogenase family protein [Polyangia bacterium]
MTAKPLFPIPMERFGEDDLALAASVSSWADREILQPRASSKHDYDALVGQAFAVLQGDVGLAAALLPESLGGAGRDRPDAAYALTLAAEEVGRADVGLAFSMACY